jgi:hypothetical protein
MNERTTTDALLREAITAGLVIAVVLAAAGVWQWVLG